MRQRISQALKLDTELEFQENAIYTSSIIVGGFNHKWGLPLPQTPALAAGSVFVLKKTGIDLKQLQKLEEQGIGERRVEGFGRIVVNWLDEDVTKYQVNLSTPETENQQDKNKLELLSADSLKIVENIATRIIKKNLDILITKRVSSIEIKKENISNSQLSRLMIITRQALSQLELERTKPESQRKTILELSESISSLLKNLSSNARSQFERTRLNTGERLDEQIDEWLKSPKGWIERDWSSDPQTKNMVENNKPYIKIANVPKSIDDYLALEYTFRLIIAITKKTIKDKNND